MSEEITVVTSPAELTRTIDAAGQASLIALDVEGNGLFVYRAKLCTVQMAWEYENTVHVAVVDTLAVDPAPLASLLGASGPTKLLHDLTFDAKLLSESGVQLANVRDTAVLAKMLGKKATGLASLLSAELGITVTKELQQHDWTRRPLGARELAYLAADVRHLAALYEKLSAEAASLDIEDEVMVESAFKLESAFAPPRERGPAYLRVKGTEGLGSLGLAVLHRLLEERESIAAAWDLPPFKVVGNEQLVALARTRPLTVDELRLTRRGLSPRLLGSSERLLLAIRAGVSDGHPPDAGSTEKRPERAVLARRRAREKRLTAWRRKEAAARGVDEQVVLPGHCLQEVVGLGESPPWEFAGIPGFGSKRALRYGAILTELLVREPETETGPPDGAAPAP